MNPINVMIVDDHQMMRAGLERLIEGFEKYSVVAEASNGVDAVRLSKKYKPDIIVMDIAMPDMNGLLATEQITSSLPNTKVLVLSTYSDEEYVLQALKSGASGYLLKDAAPQELEAAFASIAKSQVYLSPSVSNTIVNRLLSDNSNHSDKLSILTAKQQQILQLIVSGKTSKQCAELLNVSPKTVEAHRAQIMQKLEIYDLPGLVKFAIKSKLIEL